MLAILPRPSRGRGTARSVVEGATPDTGLASAPAPTSWAPAPPSQGRI
ncbi:MAG: hypothetical protein ACJAVC_001571 [Brevundimonas sp.]|jgi:hypothetical protein